jgi:actin-like ATPase involved in cell morphogenesis
MAMNQSTVERARHWIEETRKRFSKRTQRLSGFFSSDVGIDLGTANTLVYVRAKGIVLAEPSVVAVDALSNEVLAVGHKAKAMLGKTPRKIHAVRPMKDGVIADFEIAEGMLKAIIQRVIDIGGGTTEIAIISLGGIVESRSLRIAGDEFDDCIMNYMRRTYNLMIGPRTAEEIKITIGSAYPLGNNELEMEVRGRDQVAGLPLTKRINSVEIRECLAEPVQQIVESVKLTLEKCPPELAADLVERGMVLAGGGALMKGLDKALIKETGLPVFVAPNPLLAVCLGTGKALEYLDKFKKKK